ncbi:MAG: hypothetical protein GXO77_10505 [Calditrichaeota bacterium]|nr:hypothetical protein [Calditrichota bacterium]
MKIVRLIVIVSFLFAAGNAQLGNLNLNKMRYGQDVNIHTARMLGLAGSGLAMKGAIGSGIENPALIAAQAKTLLVNGGFAIDKTVEDRQFPYYDSFVGFNDYGSYSMNSNWFYSGYFNIRLSYPMPVIRRLTVQGGITPFKDFRYKYTEEVRDPNDKTDKLLGYNWIEQNGLLKLGYFSAAFEAIPDLSVGVSVGFLWGSIDSTRQIEIKISEERDRLSRQRSLQKTPVIAVFGLHYQVNNRLAVASSVRLPYRLRFENQLADAVRDTVLSVVNEKITYPLRIGAGLDYRFQNILKARVLIDFYYEYWSRFKDSRFSQKSFNDTYTVKAGVEHVFFNKVPFRIGFSYREVPENRELSRTLLTVGTGWSLNKLRINAAGGLASQEYYQHDLFPDNIYGLSPRTDLDRVKWTNYFIRLDLTYNLFE